jgi:exopolyphosphatase/guanosine-5'-triphosphate,3'-diphosphate pyrophosphatase
MRLGVIDVGSNTVHLLIVDAHPGARPLPTDSHKILLRLSEHVTDSGEISADGADRLVTFVRECQDVAEDRGVEDLMGFVTSAIRDAPNGDAVLDRVRDETGVDLEVLSGEDEARHTFLAARRWTGWSAGTLQVIDIGGGSLELVHGVDEEPDIALSVPLGAGRVTRDLLPGDPPSATTIREARRKIRATIAAQMRPLTKAPVADRVVGTSKTMRSLARLTGGAPSSDGIYVHREVHLADVTQVIGQLSTMTAAQRTGLQGISSARAGQVLGGALVAEAAMDLLGYQTLEICPWALREGIILRRLEALT